MQDPNTTRITVYWPRELDEKLKSKAERAGASVSTYIADLLAADLRCTRQYAKLAPELRVKRKVTTK